MSTIDRLDPAMMVKLLTAKGFEPQRGGTWRTAAAVADWLMKGTDLLADVEPELPKQETRLIPKEWLDDGKPSRIVAHWTAGAYLVSELDKEHYHFIIDGDNKVFRGDHSVKDNDVTGDGDYAAHTRSLNTKAIGVSVACMAGAVEKPFKEGRYPMKEDQWKTMARVTAELCKHYGIAVTPHTVLGHGEVQGTLGITQAGKWDPMVLPWAPMVPAAVVGDMFRAEVSRQLESLI